MGTGPLSWGLSFSRFGPAGWLLSKEDTLKVSNTGLLILCLRGFNGPNSPKTVLPRQGKQEHQTGPPFCEGTSFLVALKGRHQEDHHFGGSLNKNTHPHMLE